MKHILLTIFLAITPLSIVAAQQNPDDRPATKEEVQKYLEVTHAQDNLQKMMDVMSKQMQAMIHQQIAKDADKLPPDSEARMNKMIDGMLKTLPINELLDAMVPVYQKRWTKGDVDAIIAFYATPTGQKMIRELPATMAESMQAMQPILQKHMNAMMERVQQEVAQMIKDSPDKAGQKSPASPN